MKSFYMALYGLLILVIGSWLVISYSNWYTFYGVFLLLWANNIGLKINEIQK
jgi:hypothetical protein